MRLSWNNGGQGPWGSPPGGGPGGGQGGGGKGSGRPGDGRPGSGGPTGGGKRPGGPWGGGGPGGGGSLPDLDQIIAGLQGYVRGVMPGKRGGGRGTGGGGFGGGWPGGPVSARNGLILLGIAVVAIWLATGFYRVQPDEQGVVLRFGAFARTTLPGLNYHLPWPVESVLLPPVTRINRIEIGYRSAVAGDSRLDAQAPRNLPEESQMLTGDENIVDIDFALFWRVSNASRYLFDIREPEATIKSVAESVIREVIGRTPIQEALAQRRAEIEAEVHRSTQAILDRYGAGVELTQVQLQRVDPPSAVIDSFRDVQRANTDAERLRNEAESYRNDIIPRARGEAARITAEAEGARQASIAQASGQAKRFLSVLKAYRAAKDITLQRMYLETMQDIFSHTQTTIVDDTLRGVLPLLQLNTPGAAPPLPVPPTTLDAAPKAATP